MNSDLFHAVTDLCARIGWPAPTVVTRTGSTNADLVGVSGHGQVLIAMEQTAGRGRMQRTWVSRPGEGLTFSVRLDVPATVGSGGWISLLAGVAVADAVRNAGARDVGLKWPNDVMGGRAKVAGVLSQRDHDSAIVGVGLNLRFAGARPDPGAVSVAELGGRSDPDPILASVIGNLHGWWTRFVDAAGDAARCGLHAAYVDQCVTLGREVDVTEPGHRWSAVAQGIDDQGRLLVRDASGVRAISAADVTLRA